MSFNVCSTHGIIKACEKTGSIISSPDDLKWITGIDVAELKKRMGYIPESIDILQVGCFTVSGYSPAEVTNYDDIVLDF